MSGPQQPKHLELYRLIMTEVKERCAVLQTVAEQKVNVWPVAAYEMGYLQLRLVCELIALGCLAAHGDIPATYSQRLTKNYEPGRIFAELEQLHPNFYPRACSRDISFKIPGTPDLLILDDKDFMGKDELIALHGKTGNILHRGRLKNIGRGFHLDFADIEKQRNRIVDLLRVHMISLHDIKRYVVIFMQDPNFGGNVSAMEITATHSSPGWLAQEAARRNPPGKKK